LAFLIYRATDNFPRSERFGLTAQLRRAALSIPTNIVEGYARKSKKELAQFINIALGSLAETEYLFSFSNRLGYVKDNCESIEMLIEEVGRILWGFYRSAKA
jgi:four helix bundle protein